MKTKILKSLGLLTLILLHVNLAWSSQTEVKQQIAERLDAFHQTVGRSDVAFYGFFTKNASFIGQGMDALDLTELKSWSRPRLEAKGGWCYRPIQHDMGLIDENSAWFVDNLYHEKYGNALASGLLLKQQGQWLVAQYHLTFPMAEKVRNDVVSLVAHSQLAPYTMVDTGIIYKKPVKSVPLELGQALNKVFAPDTWESNAKTVLIDQFADTPSSLLTFMQSHDLKLQDTRTSLDHALDQSTDVVWFEQRFTSGSPSMHYRGNGVIKKQGERWQVIFYHLSQPLPLAISAYLTQISQAVSPAQKPTGSLSCQ